MHGPVDRAERILDGLSAEGGTQDNSDRRVEIRVETNKVDAHTR